MVRRTVAIAFFAVLTAGEAGHAQTPADNASAPYAALTRCRSIRADAERLACFDRASATFEAAVANKQVAVVNREDVRAAKRSLFGIVLPDLRLFNDKEDAEPIQQIASTVRSFSSDGLGHHVMTLAEGGTWQTIEPTRFPPAVGDNILIRRAALGSYLANIGGGRAVRVQRLR